MPVVVRTDSAIDINTIAQQIDNCVISFFKNYNINIYDLSQRKLITHNVLTSCMFYIYDSLFKPDKGMVNNQKSLIDYNDSELLSVIADKFIRICMLFDKSLGLMPFSYMTGISTETLRRWSIEDKETNPKRYAIVKSIQDGHKQMQINILNNSPVGALAVANNDHETGLEWSKNQMQQLAANTVYLVPSEQSNRLALDKAPQD